MNDKNRLKRTVFGDMSPNLMNRSSSTDKNHKPVSSDSTLSSVNFQKLSVSRRRHQFRSKSSTNASVRYRKHQRQEKGGHHLSFFFGSIDKEKCFGKDTRSELLNLSNRRSKSEVFDKAGHVHRSPRKLHRSNTSEVLDRFIPSRHTTSGKLSLRESDHNDDNNNKQSILPDFHIQSQTSKIYQNTVAEACGLEVGERILQFQPSALEKTNSSSTITNNGISSSAIQARMKKIPTCPQKVLDAPGFVDDFYLNLLSWSCTNVLAIALGNCVYCWNASSGEIDQLANCSTTVCSIRWSNDGYYLSIGLEDGSVEIWDFESGQKMRTMLGHDSRVAACSWNNHILTTGSRSGQLFHHDVRIKHHKVAALVGHTAEVCGIEWRSDGLQLATGGNDNIVNIWDARSVTPQFTKTAHTAAVKALAWCPDHTSLLATGGGSACRKIHFWNTSTGARVNTIDTNSQVSSLQWGYSNGIGAEIMATHGFPNNDISVYAYPSLQKTGVIIDAHESRVLGSSLSPDRMTVATVAADENLKFWKMFNEVKDDRNEDLTEKGMNKVIR